MSNTPTKPAKTFEYFKQSFSYGSRNDLSFKFLAGLPNEDSAAFELLEQHPLVERLLNILNTCEVIQGLNFGVYAMIITI